MWHQWDLSFETAHLLKLSSITLVTVISENKTDHFFSILPFCHMSEHHFLLWFKSHSFIHLTDIDDSKLINTDVVNSTFHHNKTGCQMTFEHDYSAYWVYFVNFLGTLAVLPGNIVSALLMDKIGRLSMLGETDIWFCWFLLYHFADVFEIHTFCYVWKNSLSVNILCSGRVFHDSVWY